MKRLIGGTVQHQVGIYLILGLNLLLSLAYGVVNPLFEAPDEHHHYFTAQWIADHGRLPSVPQPARERFFIPQHDSDWLGQEAAQPPLYYLLSSLIIAPFDTADARAQTIHNPFVRLGDPAVRVNVNAFAHGHEGWPWRGHVLAAHLLRALSAVMGTVTVWLVYKSGRLLWPNHPQRALLAAGTIAFLPQFTFQFSAISNDTLVTLLATWVLYQLLQMTLSDQLQATWWRWLLLGIAIGLTILTKNQGLLLLLFAIAFVVSKRVRYQLLNIKEPTNKFSSLSLLPYPLSFALPAVLLAMPLWWRNKQLYNDLNAVNQFVLIAGGDRGFTLWQALSEWPSIWYSFFANFGWFNVIPPVGVYWVWLVVVGMAIAGMTLSLVQKIGGAEAQRGGVDSSHYLLKTIRFLTSTPVLLLGWFLLVFAALMAFNMRTPSAQGRLLFPVLLPIGLALGYGLERFTFHVSHFTARFPFILYTLSFTLLTLTNVYCLFYVIRPVYQLPQRVDEIPESAVMYNTPLGDGLTLVAAEIKTPHTKPAQYIDLTLYWRKDNHVETRPELVIELFGRNQHLVGKLHSWHGRGLYPADLWPVGAILAEQTAVWIDPENAEGNVNKFPSLARVNIKLANQEVTQDIGTVEVEPYRYSNLQEEIDAKLGEQIELYHVYLDTTEAGPGDLLTVRPVWQVRGDIHENYATFVQLGEQGMPPVAQGDGIPLGSMYPTLYWKNGQQLWDEYQLVIPTDLPSGSYPLYVGLYRPEPPYERLPLFVDGQRQPFDAYLVDIIKISDE